MTGTRGNRTHCIPGTALAPSRGVGCLVLVIQSSPAARWMMTRRHSHSSKRMRLWRESVVVQRQVVCPQSWGSETLSCSPALSSLSRNFRRTFPKRGRQRGVPGPGARTWSPHLPPAPAAAPAAGVQAQAGSAPDTRPHLCSSPASKRRCEASPAPISHRPGCWRHRFCQRRVSEGSPPPPASPSPTHQARVGAGSRDRPAAP